MSDIQEPIKYTYILIKTDGTYLGWSKAEKEIKAGAGMEWIKWNKELPEDIDTAKYKYTNGKLKVV